MEHVYFRRLSFITAFLFLSSAVWSFFLGGMGFGEALEPVGSSWGSLFLSFSRWDLIFSTVFVWWLLVPVPKKLCYGVEA